MCVSSIPLQAQEQPIHSVLSLLSLVTNNMFWQSMYLALVNGCMVACSVLWLFNHFLNQSVIHGVHFVPIFYYYEQTGI